MNENIKHWTLYTGIFLILMLGTFGFDLLTFQYDLDNCYAILNQVDYEISNDEVHSCIKQINHPIYSHYLPNIIVSFLVWGFIVFGIGFLRSPDRW